MKLSIKAKEKLRDCIANNDVVYQRYGELVNVANEKEKFNREAILDDLNHACCIEVYSKGHQFIKEDFADLDDWSKDSDVFLLLETIGTLLCISKSVSEKYFLLKFAE